MKKTHKKAKEHSRMAGNALMVLVLVIALVGLYYMYQASTGRAFLQSPRVTQVIQRLPETCCCKTDTGNLFEVTAQVLKDADEMTRIKSCGDECEGPMRSTPNHPSILVKVGKCW